jgi:diaminopimelate decarboxylase
MKLTSRLEALKQLETPFYFYDMGLLTQTITEARSLADHYGFNLHYAMKANSNVKILEQFKHADFGVDCVSGNEVKLAASLGFNTNKILFAGVGKTDKEINAALDLDIKMFNCESIQEVEVINQLAKEKQTTAEIALRINPNVDAKTHKYITTGLNENKFGLNQIDLPNIIKRLPDLANIKLSGIHFHIGSQITDMNVFKGLCMRVNQIQQWFFEQGIKIKHINLGGGLGVDYHDPDAAPIPDFKQYFAIFSEFIHRKQGEEIHFELGRSLVAQCGSLISRALYIKQGLNTNFIVLDAGMTELMRPALYQSYHHIENLCSNSDWQEYDVVGPICESSDCFAKSINLAKTQRGDLLAIRSAGAYGEVMTSNYNLRDHHQAVYSNDLK